MLAALALVGLLATMSMFVPDTSREFGLLHEITIEGLTMTDPTQTQEPQQPQQAHQPPQPQQPHAKPVVEDLSASIAKSIEREWDEEVRCVRLFGDRYRCNWWVRDKTALGMSYSIGTIRKSRFFRVTMTPTGLHFQDHTR
jgi:hypothetical protein